MRQDLGPIAQPADIEIRAALPKTRSGKIVRRFLKAQELGEDPGRSLDARRLSGRARRRQAGWIARTRNTSSAP